MGNLGTMSKEEALNLIGEKISGCTKCGDLLCYREKKGYKTVPGEGNPLARVVFVGEAPGETEAETGRPFVGRAGKLLDILTGQVGLTRENSFVLNTLKCRPPENRDPTREEAANCRPYLELQLEVLAPSYIVCLGRVASLSLLQPPDANDYWFGKSLASMRGQFHLYQGRIKTICTYHPSFLLRNFSSEKLFLSDLKKVVDDVRNLATNASMDA